MNPSQKRTIHNILKDGAFHCVTEFRDLHIPEYRSRLNTLRREGVTLEYRKCSKHNHTGGYQEVALDENASVSSNLPPRQEITIRPVYQPAKEEIHTPRGWAYYPPPEPTYCCSIAKASDNRMHARACDTQKV
jgi:hypothetical protein